MRESIGGTWLTGIVITFLALFAAFLTYEIRYTKAFQVKNKIIEIIEQNEGYTLAANVNNSNRITDVKNASPEQLEANGSAEAEIYNFISKVGYSYNENQTCPEYSIPGTEEYGYCLQKYCVNEKNVNKTTYKVTSFISLEIPVINILVNIPISGETITLHYDVTGSSLGTKDHHCFNVAENEGK